ncbi:MAG: helix-turn-helix transcriptional regulator [Desulfobaccales bacterium]
MNTTKHEEKLIARLKDKEHRDAFVSARIQVGIPLQIRALREKRGLSQQELADQAGVKQSWIATIENPNYSGFSLKTLLKLASAFEIGLIVEFVPISNLVDRELRLSPESLTPVSFEEDPYFKPRVTNIVGQVGLVIGGEGEVGFFNPQQSFKPVTVLAKYRATREIMKESQKETESQLQREMTESQLQRVG